MEKKADGDGKESGRPSSGVARRCLERFGTDRVPVLLGIGTWYRLTGCTKPVPLGQGKVKRDVGQEQVSLWDNFWNFRNK